MKKTAKTYSTATLRKVIAILRATLEQFMNADQAPRVGIVGGNSKLGGIPAFNIPAVLTCGGNCRACIRKCYVMKDYAHNRKNVINSHCRNLAALLSDPDQAAADLNAYFDRMTAPRFFRIHSSGDFAVTIDGDPLRYARMWYEIAKNHPGTCFLAFTKCYDIARAVPFDTLPNFELVLSEWTDELEAPADLKERYRTSRAVNELADARANEMICPGNCDTCGACWNLSKVGHDVAFEIH